MVLRLLRRHQNTIGVVAYVTLMKNGVPTLMILLISTCDFDEYIFYNEFIAVAEIGMVADSGSGMIEKSSSAFYYFLLFDFLDIFLFLLLFFKVKGWRYFEKCFFISKSKNPKSQNQTPTNQQTFAIYPPHPTL